MSGKVKSGLDLLKGSWPKGLNNARCGLLVHPASVNNKLEHSVEVCQGAGRFRIVSLFGPQHGIRGETQDNMIEWEGFRDVKTGLPVYSLYGKTRSPEKAMLEGIDVMVVDLQDVGSRYYTFIWTLSLTMKACLEAGKAVVVTDRPNPLGGVFTEGPVLNPEFRSFVGLHPLPVRHGMTIGEIAVYLKDVFYPSLDLNIIEMKGWKRGMSFEETGLPWVLPSPNMPTVDTALVYPGQCLLEGTNLSEGRGTTRPFEIFGAPFVDPDRLKKRLSDFALPGLVLRPLYFLPTFQKHAGVTCGGCQIHITDRKRFRPFKTTIAILKAIHELYPEDFRWKNPPYEYEEVLLPIDILAGTDRLRLDIEGGVSLDKMAAWWEGESAAFDRKTRRKYLLYR